MSMLPEAASLHAFHAGSARVSRTHGGGPPPPGAPIPRDPAPLAARLEMTTRDLADAVDRWRASGDRRVPEDVTLDALYQQRILILLGEKRRLSVAVLRRLPPRDAKAVGSEVLARRELGRLSPKD